MSRLGNPASRNCSVLGVTPYLLTCSPLLEVARHRFAREGRTRVLKLLWLNDEGVTVLC